MFDDDIYEMADSVQNPDAVHDFLTTGAAVMVGAYVGNKLDNTRFGIWVNTNPTMQGVFTVIKTLLLLLVVGLALFFVFFCLLPQF